MDAFFYAARQSDEPRNHDPELVESILARVMEDLFDRIDEAMATKPEPQPQLPPAA